MSDQNFLMSQFILFCFYWQTLQVVKLYWLIDDSTQPNNWEQFFPCLARPSRADEILVWYFWSSGNLLLEYIFFNRIEEILKDRNKNVTSEIYLKLCFALTGFYFFYQKNVDSALEIRCINNTYFFPTLALLLIYDVIWKIEFI